MPAHYTALARISKRKGRKAAESLKGETLRYPASSIGFRDSVSFLLTIQATGFLTIALVGLLPTEYASLRWTHNMPV